MKLALGTVQFGMDYGIQGGTRPAETAVEEMLSYALEKRICYFDTASAYGNAETVLGHYRRKNLAQAEKMHMISKLAPKALSDHPPTAWKDIVLSNINRSLEKLQAIELEAFLFHNAEYIFDERAVQALNWAYLEGKAKKIGVSIYTPQEAMKALEYDEIKVIQIPYNVFDRRLDRCGFFEQASKKGVEIYARSSLLQGLAMMEPKQLPDKMQFARRYLEKFLSICSLYNVSPLKAAVCYAGAHPKIDFILFGVDNKNQLSEYSSLQKETIPFEMREALRISFEEVEEKLVNPVLWNQ